MRRVFRSSAEWQETDKWCACDGDDSEAPALASRKTDGGQGSSRKLWSDAVGEIEGQTQTQTVWKVVGGGIPKGHKRD